MSAADVDVAVAWEKRWNASAALGAAVPGGLTSDVLTEGQPLPASTPNPGPRATLKVEKDGRGPDYVSGGDYIDYRKVTVTLYGVGKQALGDVVALLRATFDSPAPLDFSAAPQVKAHMRTEPLGDDLAPSPKRKAGEQVQEAPVTWAVWTHRSTSAVSGAPPATAQQAAQASGYLQRASNLADVPDPVQARNNLGIIQGGPPSGAAGGDLTGTYPNPSLKNTGTPGTYGDASHYPVVTTDAQGRVTGVTLQTVSGGPVTANGYLASDKTFTSSVASSITGLSFSVAANEVWSAEFYLVISTTLSGMAFTLLGPAAPTFVRWTEQGFDVVSGWTDISLTAFGSDGPLEWGTNQDLLRISLLLINAGNAGTVQLQVGSTSNGQSNTVFKGSYFTARRISP